MDMDQPRPDDPTTADIDDLEVPQPDADAVTGGKIPGNLSFEDGSDPLPEKSCAG